MSSREIADRAGKTHKHVLADIRKMLAELGLTSADFSANLPDRYGRKQVAYLLPKREVLILIAGYSIPIRARIIDRWMELEAEAQSRTAPGRDLPPSGVESHNASAEAGKAQSS